MKLKYRDITNLLIEAFPEMKEIYNNNVKEYVDLHYPFYESEFVPFIIAQLRQNDIAELNRIFSFIEKLFTDGDEMIINLAGVAIVESLYFEKEYDEYKNVIFNLGGTKTLKSFNECIS